MHTLPKIHGNPLKLAKKLGLVLERKIEVLRSIEFGKQADRSHKPEALATGPNA